MSTATTITAAIESPLVLPLPCEPPDRRRDELEPEPQLHELPEREPEERPKLPPPLERDPPPENRREEPPKLPPPLLLPPLLRLDPPARAFAMPAGYDAPTGISRSRVDERH